MAYLRWHTHFAITFDEMRPRLLPVSLTVLVRLLLFRPSLYSLLGEFFLDTL